MKELSHLVEQARQGNHDAYAQIIGRFQDMAFAGAYAMLGDAALAQEAAQEAFMEAYLNLNQLQQPAAFPGWFRRILIKQSDRHLRRRRLVMVPVDTAVPVPSPLPDPAFILERQQLKDEVETAVAALPAAQRLVVTLFYIQGYSQKEIAAFLECPLSTVKKRLFDARQKLKEKLIMVEKELQANKPSQNDKFSSNVQFFIALREGQTNQVQTLIEKNPDLVHVKTEWPVAADSYYWPLGVTPLYYATGMGFLDIMRLLLDNGANANDNGQGSSHLHHAILRHQPQALRLLLDRGAEINKRDRHGLTPLHLAVIRRDAEMVTILLGNGADVQAQDDHGRTPADWAKLKKYEDMTAQLRAHGGKKLPAQTEEAPAAPPKFRQLPGAKAALGRILAADGQVRDGRAPLANEQTIQFTLDHQAPVIWETGVKMIDLIAPLKRGGQIGVFTPLAGVGRERIQAELMHNLVTHHDGFVVYLALEYGGATVASKYRQWQAEFNLPDTLLQERLIAVAAHMDDPVEQQQRIAETGLALAEELRAAGKDVLLLVESKCAQVPGVVPFLRHQAGGRAAGSLTLLFDGDYTVGLEPADYNGLDAILTFDRERGARGLWPALDPLRSTSSLLQRPDCIGVEHITLVTAVRRLFQRYQELHHSYEYAQFEAMFYLNDLESDQQTVIRARRLHSFLSQPLATTEIVTGYPGQHVPLAATLAAVRAILNGDFNDTPEEDLYFRGAL